MLLLGMFCCSLFVQGFAAQLLVHSLRATKAKANFDVITARGDLPLVSSSSAATSYSGAHMITQGVTSSAVAESSNTLAEAGDALAATPSAIAVSSVVELGSNAAQVSPLGSQVGGHLIIGASDTPLVQASSMPAVTAGHSITYVGATPVGAIAKDGGEPPLGLGSLAATSYSGAHMITQAATSSAITEYSDIPAPAGLAANSGTSSVNAVSPILQVESSAAIVSPVGSQVGGHLITSASDIPLVQASSMPAVSNGHTITTPVGTTVTAPMTSAQAGGHIITQVDRQPPETQLAPISSGLAALAPQTESTATTLPAASSSSNLATHVITTSSGTGVAIPGMAASSANMNAQGSSHAITQVGQLPPALSTAYPVLSRHVITQAGDAPPAPVAAVSPFGSLSGNHVITDANSFPDASVANVPVASGTTSGHLIIQVGQQAPASDDQMNSVDAMATDMAASATIPVATATASTPAVATSFGSPLAVTIPQSHVITTAGSAVTPMTTSASNILSSVGAASSAGHIMTSTGNAPVAIPQVGGHLITKVGEYVPPFGVQGQAMATASGVATPPSLVTSTGTSPAVANVGLHTITIPAGAEVKTPPALDLPVAADLGWRAPASDVQTNSVAPIATDTAASTLGAVMATTIPVATATASSPAIATGFTLPMTAANPQTHMITTAGSTGAPMATSSSTAGAASSTGHVMTSMVDAPVANRQVGGHLITKAGEYVPPHSVQAHVVATASVVPSPPSLATSTSTAPVAASVGLHTIIIPDGVQVKTLSELDLSTVADDATPPKVGLSVVADDATPLASVPLPVVEIAPLPPVVVAPLPAVAIAPLAQPRPTVTSKPAMVFPLAGSQVGEHAITGAVR